MNKKIIITGAAGFIGFHTAVSYLKKGYLVLGIDNLNDSYDLYLKSERIKKLKKFDRFSFKKIDISNFKLLSNVFNSFCKEGLPDAVINLAAKTGVRKSTSEPYSYYVSNVIGCLNIVKLVNKFNINKLIHASTSSVYGNSKKKSFSVESETSKPVSNYAASKKSSEILLHAFHELYKMNIIILRFFTVYGPYGRPDMSPFIFIESNLRKKNINLFGTGNQKRDFTYIDDIVTGISKSVKLKGFNILNLGNNNPVRINKLLKNIETLSKIKNKIKKSQSLKEDVDYTSANINKTKKLISWEPITNFNEGITRTFNWHIDNREWLKKIKI